MAVLETRGGILRKLWTDLRLSHTTMVCKNRYDNITRCQQSAGERIVEIFNYEYKKKSKTDINKPIVCIYGQNLGGEYYIFAKKLIQNTESETLLDECVLTMIINFRSEEPSVRYYWGEVDRSVMKYATHHVIFSCLDCILPDITNELIINLVA